MGNDDPTPDRYAEVLSKVYALILSWNDQEQNQSGKDLSVTNSKATPTKKTILSRVEDEIRAYSSLLKEVNLDR